MQGAKVAVAFFESAAAFGGMCLYGYTTKKDLTNVGAFCFMALIGLIVIGIVNIFVHSSLLELLLAVATLAIFTGLTMWDVQNLKETYNEVAGDKDAAARVGIMGALELYLDFLNIFLAILRINEWFGGSSDSSD